MGQNQRAFSGPAPIGFETVDTAASRVCCKPIALLDISSNRAQVIHDGFGLSALDQRLFSRAASSWVRGARQPGRNDFERFAP